MVLSNIPIKVMNNEIMWNTLRRDKGWKLEQNIITGHARILNPEDIRLAWGSVQDMTEAFDQFVKPWKGCKKGDIIAVQRIGGVYSHYAVYIGYGKVIHYGMDTTADDKSRWICTIHKADFSEFLGTDTCYEVLSFPEDGSDPIHKSINLFSQNGTLSFRSTFRIFPELKAMLRHLKGYHLYSAKETVDRAYTRLGEDEYSLAFNNCEHFALWCKTGLRESSQVDDFWKRFWVGRSILV
ncbi:lecithin retinol acyltransferase family protein [Butyrivibrio sp. VCB2001]|uniref:lecithin retinol acyltransferase family protein n=1 Tax=Butyrivibrio sp. VCB2001 TaxID=1280667 RepID=UPI0004175FCD|nr:lecithin retinol acyltransferase family protein [Butyrivibrio sp. VCB2001]